MKGIGSRFLVGSLSLTFFQGCMDTVYKPEAFLSEYQKRFATVSEQGGYRFVTFFAIPDFLAAKRFRSQEKIPVEKYLDLKGTLSNSLYVSLSLGPDSKAVAGGSDGNLLNVEAVKGRGAFSDRLNLFQNGMAAYCFLRLSSGENIPVSTYSFDRGWASQSPVSFLFVFPKIWNGKSVSLDGAKFVVKEFGLNIGNLEQPLKAPTGMKLKV